VKTPPKKAVTFYEYISFAEVVENVKKTVFSKFIMAKFCLFRK